MEAAATILRELPARRRAAAFERECEGLRPLGEAYALRRFGPALSRADAEDAVAEVLIRLHRAAEEGRAPENLRAAFFTSVRNAAIDLLRSRAAKPTAPLEAAADAPALAAIPAERAESREEAVRLGEALRRMRGNYREAIVLRFGLGLSVPEIARHMGVSLPAAKKLVLRATAQVKKRLESIEGAEFCPEMRELARRSLLEKEASGLASEAEAEILRAHFQHCGSCRSFLARLHGALHELGAGALLGGLGADAKVGFFGHLSGWAGDAIGGAQAGVEKLRLAAYKAAGPLHSGDAGAAGALAGTSQKIVAICGAGAAATATCLATGAIGPGLGATAPPASSHDSPPAQVRTETDPLPVPSAPASDSAPRSNSDPDPPADSTSRSEPSPAPAPTPTPAEQSRAEFGVESPPPAPPTSAPAPTPSSPASSGSAGAGSGSQGAGGGGESFGFNG